MPQDGRGRSGIDSRYRHACQALCYRCVHEMLVAEAGGQTSSGPSNLALRRRLKVYMQQLKRSHLWFNDGVWFAATR